MRVNVGEPYKKHLFTIVVVRDADGDVRRHRWTPKDGPNVWVRDEEPERVPETTNQNKPTHKRKELRRSTEGVVCQVIDDNGVQTQQKWSNDGPTASNDGWNYMRKSGLTYDVAWRYVKYRECRECCAKHGWRRMKVHRAYTTSRESKTWD